MEMQKQLTMIGGIPSSGKTTFARKFVKTFGLEKEFCVDYIYFEIGGELGIKDFANPRIWRNEKPELVKELKRKYYEKMLPRDNKILIEGYGLMFREDREIIKQILDDYQVTYFYKDISFEDWLKQKRVIDCKSRREEFDYLRKLGTLEEGTITIK